MCPVSITYSIFALDCDDKHVLMTQPKEKPHSSGHGCYHVRMTIPTNWPDGQYVVVWYIQYYSLDERESQVCQEFQVVRVDPATSSMEAPSVLFTPKKIILPKYTPVITLTRQLLSDENPERNYHFRPPTASKVIAHFTDRVGFIWTDETIMRFATLAVSKLNWFNKRTIYSYTLDTVPFDWGQVVCIGAAASCLSKEASRWAEEEFGYSLNGVNVDIRKSDLYRGLRESYLQEFDDMADRITAIRPASVGLRQQRWLLG